MNPGSQETKQLTHDFAGLLLIPPERALVLRVDEMSRSQALERNRPVLMKLGYVEGLADDYYRHGTTTLFATLNVVRFRGRWHPAEPGLTFD